MFHGPIFQSIRSVLGWSDAGIDAHLSDVSLNGFFIANERPQLVFNPVMLDAMGQIAAYWIAQQIGTDFNCFPASIERIELYHGAIDERADLQLRARQRPVDPTADSIEALRSWDFECLTAGGDAVVRVTGLVNSFYPVPNRFYQVRRDPLNAWLGQAGASSEAGLNWQLSYLEPAFCSISSGIFERIIALIYLDETEREVWHARNGSATHWREWLHVHIAIKEAVRYWLWEQTGELVYASEIQVHQVDGAAYIVAGDWEVDLMPAPEVRVAIGESECNVIVVSEIDSQPGIEPDEAALPVQTTFF